MITNPHAEIFTARQTGDLGWFMPQEIPVKALARSLNVSSGMVPSAVSSAVRPSPLQGMEGTPAWATTCSEDVLSEHGWRIGDIDGDWLQVVHQDLKMEDATWHVHTFDHVLFCSLLLVF